MDRVPASPPRLRLQLIVIATTMLVLMTLYEGLKQFLVPEISIWGSHAVTIIFTTALATLISFFVLRKFYQSYQERLDEIDRRKKTEDILRASEEKYRLLFEQSRDAISIVTSEGQFIDVNPAYERLLGYRRDEIIELTAENMWCDGKERNRWKEAMEEKGFVINYERMRLHRQWADAGHRVRNSSVAWISAGAFWRSTL